MIEIFKDIAGYEGLYQVSNLGRVKSLNYNHTRKERILNPGDTGKGYLFVSLYKKGIKKNFRVHKLVAEAFLDNPNNLPEINHIDQNKQNNSIDNLEFCTRQYNVTYADRHLIRSKKIGCYKDNKLIRSYPSIHSVEKDGFNHKNVYSCLIGRYKTSRGFQWKYLS